MSENILNKIASATRQRYAEIMKTTPMSQIKANALAMPQGGFEFETALKKQGLSYICEVKKASPSKGLISPDFPYLEIARKYEAAGADCISCLTEPQWFLGSNEYLRRIAEAVSIPVLRKDFTVCDYQIYEAKLLGASAVLLICALLSQDEIREYTAVCDALGMSALAEAHDEREIESALLAGARIIGVNNRNLKDFSVDVNNSTRYRKMIPQNVLFVSESGIKTRADTAALEQNKTDAVLIGEALMRSPDIANALKELKGGKN